MTAPALKAMLKARATPVFAPSATRVFARTATFMPMNPAAAENTAPIRKPNAVPQPRSFQNPITRKRTIATTAIVWYCRRRYAEAPSCTAREISCMRSLPGDCCSSHHVSTTP